MAIQCFARCGPESRARPRTQTDYERLLNGPSGFHSSALLSRATAALEPPRPALACVLLCRFLQQVPQKPGNLNARAPRRADQILSMNRRTEGRTAQLGGGWPVLSTVEYSQKLDYIRVDPVDRDPQRACNHKLTRTSHATAPSKRRLPTQRLHRVIDSATHLVREGEGAFFLDPGGDVFEIRECVRGPLNPHQEDSRAS